MARFAGFPSTFCWFSRRSAQGRVDHAVDVDAGGQFALVRGTSPASPLQLGLLLAVAVPASAGLAIFGFWPLWTSDPTLAATNTLLVLAILTIGIVLLAEPGQLGSSLGMIASGLLLLASWCNIWTVGPLPFISQAVGLQWVLAGGWALYRYPDHHLTRSEHIALGAMLAWFVLTPWVTAVVSRPEWHGFPADGWWPTLWPNRNWYRIAGSAINAGTLAFVGLYVSRWIIRLRTARPAERKLKTPTSIAALITAALASSVPIGGLLHVPSAATNVLYLVSALGVLSVPVAFLVSVLRRQMARSKLAALVTRLYGVTRPIGVQAALRDGLDDPTLTLGIWSAERNVFLAVDNGAVIQAEAANRLRIPVNSAAGGGLATVSVDSALARDPELIAAAAAAAGLTLQNAVLLSRVQAQYQELRDASTRVVKGADEERRRLGQLLHDGAQQHFLALGLMIGATEAGTADPSTKANLAEMRTQLEHALGELAQLARGLHPTVLRMGLAGAVKETMRRYVLDVVVELPDAPMPEATETTAYYAICEAVANTVKHARASRVHIRGELANDVLHLVVEDDGVGGAHFGTHGRGLDALHDRLTTLGGSVTLHSRRTEGTRVAMEIPCV